MDFMQQQMTQLNIGWDARFETLTTHVNSHFNSLNLRLDSMQTQVDNVEEDAYFARWYNTQTYENNVQGDDEHNDPPTPPHTRCFVKQQRQRAFQIRLIRLHPSNEALSPLPPLHVLCVFMFSSIYFICVNLSIADNALFKFREWNRRKLYLHL